MYHYQIAKFNNAKPQLLLHQPNNSTYTNVTGQLGRSNKLKNYIKNCFITTNCCQKIYFLYIYIYTHTHTHTNMKFTWARWFGTLKFELPLSKSLKTATKEWGKLPESKNLKPSLPPKSIFFFNSKECKDNTQPKVCDAQFRTWQSRTIFTSSLSFLRIQLGNKCRGISFARPLRLDGSSISLSLPQSEPSPQHPHNGVHYCQALWAILT